MSAIVTNILAQINSIAADTLGLDYQPLQFVYDLTKLNDRTATLAYGVRPWEASVAPSVNKTYALHHRFEFILTDTIARVVDDSQVADSFGIMYDKSDEIFKALVNTKVNLPTTVLNVFEPALSTPEFITSIIVLRMQFKILYRSALS